jgi:uncharacterized protein involved in tellurium resistance
MSDVDEKIANPLNFYNKPSDVELDNGLSRIEKIKILENWLNDIELRETAQSENMCAMDDVLDENDVIIIERLLHHYKINAH